MITVFYDCYQVLSKVYGEGAYLSQALSSTQIDNLKRREITKICYGVLDKDITLSYYLKRLCPKQPKMSVRILAKIAMYSIEFLQKQPHTVVNCTVELCKKLGKKGVSGFLNAILRSFINNKIVIDGLGLSALSLKHSYPEFAIKLLQESYSTDNILQIMSYNKTHNYVRFSAEIDGFSYLKTSEIKFEKTPFENLFDVSNMSYSADFNSGVFTFQSVGSVAICNAFSGGETLIDCCSAPGGKSVLLADKYKNVTSCDVHEHRVNLVKSYAKRMHKDNVVAINQDATVLNPNFVGKFDGVLCDVPCSGFGTVYSSPDIKLNKSLQTVLELCKIQYEILNNCSKYVSKNGELIYSTCSIFQRENDCVIELFLKNNVDFEVCEITSPLKSLKTKFGLQFLPHLSLGAGFYMCKLVKKV